MSRSRSLPSRTTTDNAASTPRDLLTVAEVARRLRISRPTAYRLVEVGKLAALHVGIGRKHRVIRIPAASLEAFINSASGPGSAA